jgi:predicted O-methyltransferase YrrM
MRPILTPSAEAESGRASIRRSMSLPSAFRSRMPPRVRDHPGVRAVALAVGLIPPRAMHTRAEAEVLRRCATGARCVVEIGVYEGSSAIVFCDALSADADLHLIDPFTDESGWAMRPGWHGTPFATRAAVRRSARGGPRVRWHVARSQDVGRAWDGQQVDLVFIDGDHSPTACGEDWQVWHHHVRPGGAVAFHDARHGRADGDGGIGPTQVVDELRERMPAGWQVGVEVDTLVVFKRIV